MRGQCTRRVGALFAALVFSGFPSWAGARLGLYEARVLVEHTPGFLHALQSGYCPQSSDGAVDGNAASFVIRGECKYLGVIGDFGVDLTTGAVTQDGISGPIDTPELAGLRKRMFAARAAERISGAEAVCLVRRSVDATASCEGIKATREDDSFFDVTVAGSCGGAGRDRAFEVDRYTGIVTDPGTRRSNDQQAGASLRQEMLTAHLPPRLTVEEAKVLLRSSLVVPGSGIPKCLAIDVDPDYNADEIWFQVRICDSTDVVRVVVDVVVGDVRVTGRSFALDSSRFAAARAEAIASATARQSAAADAVRGDCP